MKHRHDIKAALLDLRARYEASGWHDQGMTDSIREMADALGIDEVLCDTEMTVRRVIHECIWFNEQDDFGKSEALERDAVGRLMRLIRHREGR